MKFLDAHKLMTEGAICRNKMIQYRIKDERLECLLAEKDENRNEYWGDSMNGFNHLLGEWTLVPATYSFLEALTMALNGTPMKHFEHGHILAINGFNSTIDRNLQKSDLTSKWVRA